MRPGDSKLLFLTPSTAFLAPGKTALLLAQIPQPGMVMSRVIDLLPAGERRRGFLNFGAKAHEIPSRGIKRKGHQIRSIDAGQRFGEFENPEFR